MAKPLDPSKLIGSWLHAYEEDNDTERVFRPATAPLPPSRGRAGLSFETGGALSISGPQADDTTGSRQAHWVISGSDTIEIDANLFGIDGKQFSVRRTGNKLVLKPLV